MASSKSTNYAKKCGVERGGKRGSSAGMQLWVRLINPIRPRRPAPTPSIDKRSRGGNTYFHPATFILKILWAGLVPIPEISKCIWYQGNLGCMCFRFQNGVAIVARCGDGCRDTLARECVAEWAGSGSPNGVVKLGELWLQRERDLRQSHGQLLPPLVAHFRLRKMMPTKSWRVSDTTSPLETTSEVLMWNRSLRAH
jgi:hypothetical protein